MRRPESLLAVLLGVILAFIFWTGLCLLLIGCNPNPFGPEVAPRTDAVAYTEATAEVDGVRRKLSEKPITFSHDTEVGGRRVMTIVTATDSIRIAFDIRDRKERNSVHVYSR